MIVGLPDRAFYLLFGPFVGAAVGAGTMAYMHRSDHPSQIEANVNCQRWIDQQVNATRHCLDDEPTRQVLGWESPEPNIGQAEMLKHPQSVVMERFQY